MVRLEDGKGLARGAGVVGALGGLDRLGHLGGAAARRRRVLALRVGRGLVQRGEDGGGRGQDDEEAGEMHFLFYFWGRGFDEDDRR